MSCGDARSIVTCEDCRFRVSCALSDERYKYVGETVSRCPNCNSKEPLRGKFKYCSNCGSLMEHGIIPTENNVSVKYYTQD